MPEQSDLLAQAHALIEAFNTGDWDRQRELIAPDVSYHELGTRRQVEGELEEGWRRAFPDVTGTVTNALAEGNTVVLEVQWEGTQTGPLTLPEGTIPASGRTQITPSIWLLQFEGDRVVESRHYFDSMTILQQIGAVPEPE